MSQLSRRPIFLAVLTGLLLVLCWPPFSLFPLQLVCLIPLLILSESHSGKSLKTCFLLSSISFAIWGTGTLFWIAKASLLSAVASVLILALLSAAVFTSYQLFLNKLLTSSSKFSSQSKRVLAYTILISAWICIEFLKENVLNYPWLNLGFSLASFPAVIQYYEYTGPYGGSFYILLSNILIYELIRSHKKNLFLKLGSVCWILIPVMFSLYRFITYADYSSPVEIRIVQAGKSFFKPKGEVQPYLLDTLISLSRKHAAINTEYFIWPESAFEPWHALNEDSIAGQVGIEKIRSFLETYRHGSVIAGVLTYIIPSLKNRDTLWYNSALCVESGGKIQIYHKQRLVPGSEGGIFSIPFGWKSRKKETEGVSDKLFLQTKNRHFLNVGDDQDIFYSHAGIGTAPVICFESVFGHEVSLKVAKGAQFISLITNDAWWGRSAGTYQHLDYARMLAIENRRWVVRASLGGISAAINPEGSVTHKIDTENSGIINVAVNAAEELSFYTRYGDCLAYLCLVVFLFSCLAAVLIFSDNRHSPAHSK